MEMVVWTAFASLNNISFDLANADFCTKNRADGKVLWER